LLLSTIMNKLNTIIPLSDTTIKIPSCPCPIPPSKTPNLRASRASCLMKRGCICS
jgi:hypothetical protein